MEELVLDNGLKKIAIKNQEGELVTVLQINIADAQTAERFANLIQNLNKISDECEKEAKKIDIEFGTDEEIDVEKVIVVSKLKTDYLNRIISEIDSVFGENTIRNIYSESYDNNPDFVPDEVALVEFIDKVIPVMNGLFGKRFETYKKKYNPGKKGKHTKSKKELIEEYREKSNV